MGYDTSRRALRAALPPFLFGFLVWIASVGLHAFRGFDLAAELNERLPLERIAAIAGAVASGLVLVGASQLMRARVDNRRVKSALAFFALWLAELVLRLWTLAARPDNGFDLLAGRILLANLAMLALCAAMLRIGAEGVRRPEMLRSWRQTAQGFALQLLLGALLWYELRTGTLAGTTVGVGAEDGLLGRLFDASLWLLLVAPYAHAYLSLQRSASKVAATETVAEILSR